MTSRPRSSQEEAGTDQQQQQRKSKRRRSGPQSEKKNQEEQTMGLEASNGADTNGSGSIASYTGPQGLINRNEYLRLLQQSLSQLGFNDVAELLEKRSGVPRQSSTTSQLTECVLNGDWTGALEAVSSLDLGSKTAAQVPFLILEQKFLEILDTGDELAAIKCLRNDLAPLSVNTERLHDLSRKLLAAQGRQAAASSSPSPSTLSPAAAAAAAASASAKATSGRRKLLLSLQNIVPAGTLLPENRLEELVEQALSAQIEKCSYHNTLHPRASLLHNYTCGLEQLPVHCSQILEAHTSEVWHLQFSHNGKMLATCGRDNKVILWDFTTGAADDDIATENGEKEKEGKDSDKNGKPSSSSSSSPGQFRLRGIISGHKAPVLFLAWSPDDSILASCGQDSTVRLYQTAPEFRVTETGLPMAVLKHHSEPVLSVAWLPDNKTLVTAGQDRMVAVVGIDASVHQSWRAHRMQDVSVTAGGRYILASTHDRRINVYEALIRPKEVIQKENAVSTTAEGEAEIALECPDEKKIERERLRKGHQSSSSSSSIEDTKWLFTALFDSNKQRDSTLLEGEDLMAFSSSPCGRYLLANLRDGSLSLWDLGSRSHRILKPPVGLVSRFLPPDNPEGTLGRFVVRSCIGGVSGKFIATGTENGKVPIWQRDTGELLAVLKGHSGVVNAVAWNRAMPEMLATASDDGTVRIWQSSASSGGGRGSGGNSNDKIE